MAEWTYLNNDLIPEKNAGLHFSDLALMRGYGVFDFLRVQEGHPLFLEQHLDRFRFSARQMHLDIPASAAELEKRVRRLIFKNQLMEGGIRLTLTGGYSKDGYSLALPNLLITTHAFQPPTAMQFEKGICLMSYEHQRQLPEVKSIDYLMAIWLQPLLREKKADEVLYHSRGQI